MVLRGMAFQNGLAHGDGAQVEVKCPYERSPRGASLYFSAQEDKSRRYHFWEIGFLSDIKYASPLVLDFLDFETVRKKYLLFISYWIYSIIVSWTDWQNLFSSSPQEDAHALSLWYRIGCIHIIHQWRALCIMSRETSLKEKCFIDFSIFCRNRNKINCFLKVSQLSLLQNVHC